VRNARLPFVVKLNHFEFRQRKARNSPPLTAPAGTPSQLAWSTDLHYCRSTYLPLKLWDSFVEMERCCSRMVGDQAGGLR